MVWLERIARWFVLGLALVLTLFAWAAVLSTGERVDGMGYLHLGFLLFGWFPAVLVHELGHAIVAQAVGWRVIIFHVAPWALRLRPFRLVFAGNLGGPDVGGFVLSIPRSPITFTRARAALVYAGGPIASWMLALICLAATAWLPWETIANAVVDEPATLSPQYLVRSGLLAISTPEHGAVLEADFFRALCLATGLLSVVAGLVTTWPMRIGSTLNDAALILADRHKALASPDALSWALELTRHGAPQHTWDAWIRNGVAAAAAGSGRTTAAHYVAFLAALLEADDTATRAARDALLAAAPDSTEVRIVDAFVAALLDCDPKRADDILARLPGLKGVNTEILRLRSLAIATILAHEGDRPQALNFIYESGRLESADLSFPGGVWQTLNDRVANLARAPIH